MTTDSHPYPLFVDLDGVLADFDSHYLKCFGYDPRTSRDDPSRDPANFWQVISDHGNFYAELPLMPDALELWTGLLAILHRGFVPQILTGLPHSIPEAEAHKRWWVRRYIDPIAPVTCCLSKDKRKFCSSGAILIDDWTKYQHLWEEAGGIFVVHRSAKESLRIVKGLLAR